MFEWLQGEIRFSLGDSEALVAVDQGNFDLESEWNDAALAFFGEDDKWRVAAREWMGE